MIREYQHAVEPGPAGIALAALVDPSVQSLDTTDQTACFRSAIAAGQTTSNRSKTVSISSFI
jgi:hypothetical protein